MQRSALKITSVQKLFRIEKRAKPWAKFMSQASGWHIDLSVFHRRQMTLRFARQRFYPDQKNVGDLAHHIRQPSRLPRSFIRCRYAKPRAAAGGEGATPDTNHPTHRQQYLRHGKCPLVITETMKSQALHIWHYLAHPRCGLNLDE
jgi:hypothetical protein